MKLLTFASNFGINKLIENKEFLEKNKEFFGKLERIYIVYSSEMIEKLNKKIFEELVKDIRFIHIDSKIKNDSEKIVIELKRAIEDIETDEIIFDNKHGTGDMREAAMSLYLLNPSSKLLSKKGQTNDKGDWIENTIELSEKEEFYRNRKGELRNQIKVFIKEGYFHVASKLLDDASTKNLLRSEEKYLMFLKNVTDGLHYWSLFNHEKAAERFGAGKRILNEFFYREAVYEKIEKEIDRSMAFLNKIKMDKRDNNDFECEESLVDRYNNIRLCIMQGRFDDAVARGYSLADAIAKYELGKRIDFEKIKSLEEFEKMISKKNEFSKPLYKTIREKLAEYYKLEKKERIRFGVSENYLLILLFDSKIAEIFFKKIGCSIDFESRYLKGELLEKRNTSILAHGKNPCDETMAKKWEELNKEILQALNIEIKDYPSIKSLIESGILEELKITKPI